MKINKLHTIHRFLDEAGHGKRRKNILGTEGVSKCFILGMVKFKQELEPLRKGIIELQAGIQNDPYFKVPSVIKKIDNGGFFFHAKDDLPEVRKIFFDFIMQKKLSFEAVVARKSIERFATTHKDKEQYFYADALSHLLKNKFHKGQTCVEYCGERNKHQKS
jgi:hypothetical protein